MKNSPELCPFAKPILGKWYYCEYVKLGVCYPGKMICAGMNDLQRFFHNLAQAIK